MIQPRHPLSLLLSHLIPLGSYKDPPKFGWPSLSLCVDNQRSVLDDGTITHFDCRLWIECENDELYDMIIKKIRRRDFFLLRPAFRSRRIVFFTRLNSRRHRFSTRDDHLFSSTDYAVEFETGKCRYVVRIYYHRAKRTNQTTNRVYLMHGEAAVALNFGRHNKQAYSFY